MNIILSYTVLHRKRYVRKYRVLKHRFCRTGSIWVTAEYGQPNAINSEDWSCTLLNVLFNAFNCCKNRLFFLLFLFFLVLLVYFVDILICICKDAEDVASIFRKKIERVMASVVVGKPVNGVTRTEMREMDLFSKADSARSRVDYKCDQQSH